MFEGPGSSTRRALPVLTISTLLAACCVVIGGVLGCGGYDGYSMGLAKEGEVSTLTTATQVTDVTGNDAVDPEPLLLAADGSLYFFDAVSRSVVNLATDGTATLFTSQTDLTTVTAMTPALLGPLDQIGAGGALADELICADSISGLIIRIDSAGTPVVHVTEADITAVTGETGAAMRLPRSLTHDGMELDAVMAQDTVSGDILKIDDLGVVTVLVDQNDIATESGLPVEDAVVAEWTRGPDSGSHFGRLDGSNHVIRVQIDGTIDRHVDGTALVDLFSDITDLRLLGVAAHSDDTLFLLVGEVTMGAGIAEVSPDGSEVSVFADSKDFEFLLGASFDVVHIGVFGDGLPYAIDGVSDQVLAFSIFGKPGVFASQEEIETVTGETAPVLSVSTIRGALDEIAFFETKSESFLTVIEID